jgi:uncharacterized surface protein with fasciclin (FAS1) repeats
MKPAILKGTHHELQSQDARRHGFPCRRVDIRCRLRRNDQNGWRRGDVSSKNIIQNAVNSKDNTTLVAAVKAAGLVDTLQGPGPFTVFAPTNAAFAHLPPGTVDSLLKPENKGQLTTVLTYHVVPGHLTTDDLKNAIKEGGGQAAFTTVQGEPLTITEKGRTFDITDSKGNTARITIADVLQSNGVIHVINKVLMP